MQGGNCDKAEQCGKNSQRAGHCISWSVSGHDLWRECNANSTQGAVRAGLYSSAVLRVRRRYQMTMRATEAAKISVEIALISGVIPRRRRPQISSGRVLSRPM